MIRERGEAPKEAPPRSGVPPLPPPISPSSWWKLDDEERQEVLELLSVWVPELSGDLRDRPVGLHDELHGIDFELVSELAFARFLSGHVVESSSW